MSRKLLHLLIVDDNDRMRRLLRDILDDLSVHIDEAVDGEEAVERFASLAPDLVLMDIRMPRLDGIAATAKIMTLNPGAYVIIVTEHNHPAYRSGAKDAGAMMYFIKDRLVDLHDFLAGLALHPN
jgi:CheY-like chemotaxis protein